MKTEIKPYTRIMLICMAKDCGHKVMVENDYIIRNSSGLKQEIKLLCTKCGGKNFKRLLK